MEMNYFLGNDRSWYKFISDEHSVDMYDGDVCFCEIFESFYDDDVYTNINMNIIFFKNVTDKNCHTTNRTLLTESELHNWFKVLQKVSYFDYTLQLLDADRYMMNIRVDQANKLQLLWLLTGIRNVYENLNALVLKDVYKLMRFGLISSENTINIFKVLMTTYKWGSSQTWDSGSGCLQINRTIEDQKKAISNIVDDVNEMQHVDRSPFYSEKSTLKQNAFGSAYQDKYFKKTDVFKRYKVHYLPIIEQYKKNNLLLLDFKYVR